MHCTGKVFSQNSFGSQDTSFYCNLATGFHLRIDARFFCHIHPRKFVYLHLVIGICQSQGRIANQREVQFIPIVSQRFIALGKPHDVSKAQTFTFGTRKNMTEESLIQRGVLRSIHHPRCSE